jgi:pantoate--beta-alanine ligase
LKIIRSLRSMREFANEAGRRRIGFVPTMGYLHEGHLRLLDNAVKETDVAVMSVFVNPLQFGPQEDFQRYPRDISRDRALARDRGCAVMFCPSARDMYPPGFSTSVRVKSLENKLCGKSRPGHFQGVCTVVLKLVNIVRPDRLYLGQKDAQQSIIIKRMVDDMNLGVSVRVCATVREPDGLAMSSRNVYLTEGQRAQAPAVYRALRAGAAAISKGERSPAKIRRIMRGEFRDADLARVEYLEVVDPVTLETPPMLGGQTLLAAAVWFGRTRLIDNVMVRARGVPRAAAARLKERPDPLALRRLRRKV